MPAQLARAPSQQMQTQLLGTQQQHEKGMEQGLHNPGTQAAAADSAAAAWCLVGLTPGTVAAVALLLVRHVIACWLHVMASHMERHWALVKVGVQQAALHAALTTRRTLQLAAQS